MPKLTLSADKAVIEKAKQLAEARGTSVSAMFSRYIDSLSSPERPHVKPAPITRRLRGLAKVPSERTDRELYEAAILEQGRR